MTREEMAEIEAKVVAACEPRHSFQEAYRAGVPYVDKRRGKYIVPTEVFRRAFGSKYKFLEKEFGFYLASAGWKRTTRQIYERSKRTLVVSVWVFEK